MNKNKLYLGGRNLIKWYEYTMDNEEAKEDDIISEDSLDDENAAEEASNENIEDDENLLENSGLNDDDKALVADIMLRFQQASQDRVDSVFDKIAEDNAPKDDMSEEEIIASLCKPKQSTVDALIDQAKNS